MRNLFFFIYRFRAFLIFLLLEILCVFMLVRYNTYQGAAIFNSATTYVGYVLEFQSSVKDYFRLASINNTLATENAALRAELMKYRHDELNDSLQQLSDSLYVASDSAKALPYILHAARVINNSIRRTNNYLTLSIGSEAGVRPQMGVITPDGIVGRVKTVGKRYSTVTSILHSQMLVSAKIKRDNTSGTIRWTGGDYRTALLDYVPLHVKPVIGDTVVTSGYSTVFPQGIMIGTISSVEREPDKSFYNIEVKLAVDFAQLSYVYVVEDPLREEREKLERDAGIKSDEP